MQVPAITLPSDAHPVRRVDAEQDQVGAGRVLNGFTVFEHAITRGSLAAYFPEANCLVPLDPHDALSGTPSYKSVSVTIRATLAA